MSNIMDMAGSGPQSLLIVLSVTVNADIYFVHVEVSCVSANRCCPLPMVPPFISGLEFGRRFFVLFSFDRNLFKYSNSPFPSVEQMK